MGIRYRRLVERSHKRAVARGGPARLAGALAGVGGRRGAAGPALARSDGAPAAARWAGEWPRVDDTIHLTALSKLLYR